MPSSAELKIAVQEPKSWSRKLSITVPPERVRSTRDSVAGRIARDVRLPGFRKGKVPQRVLEKQFGPSIEQETLDRVIQEAYREALESQGLHPITQGAVENVHYHEGEELHFDVEFEVQPEITIERTEGLVATRPSAEVDPSEVDGVLERLRQERGVWEPVEDRKPDYGDQVMVEMEALEGEEAGSGPRAYRFVLGENQAIPEIEDAIMTLSTGEENEFTVRFPEDFQDPEQAGKEQRLRIRLNGIQAKSLPELDDELARELGEFDDLEALRARILDDLRSNAEDQAEAEVRNQLMAQLLEANPFEVPESMVERYLAHLTGDTEERRNKLSPQQQEQISQWRASLRPQAEQGLKRLLVVERVADAQALRATQDEIDARVEEIAEKHGRTASEVWLQLEKSGELESLEGQITEDKVFDFLKSRNTVA